jgi:hypothetical protein
MLPGDIPGRGAPGRGACGRGIGRSTGCAEENGMLPTRGVRAAGLGAGPGLGPGVAPGVAPGAGAGRVGVGAAGGASAASTGGAAAAGSAGAAGAAGAAGLGAAGFAGAFGAAALAGEPLPLDFAFSAALEPPKASRNRRATGASTVEEADLTNSPCSLSRARTSLLVTPSSLANSCTRALPATTSPSLEATSGGRRRASG